MSDRITVAQPPPPTKPPGTPGKIPPAVLIGGGVVVAMVLLLLCGGAGVGMVVWLNSKAQKKVEVEVEIKLGPETQKNMDAIRKSAERTIQRNDAKIDAYKVLEDAEKSRDPAAIRAAQAALDAIDAPNWEPTKK